MASMLGISQSTLHLLPHHILSILTEPLYKSDNAMVYSLLKEATRGTFYSSTMNPYQKGKNGRAAWLSLVSSHAGQDKWEQLNEVHNEHKVEWTHI